MDIGIVGLGRMGANMARRLMHGGHECVVRTTGMRIGLLMNFHESTLKQGLKRIIV